MRKIAVRLQRLRKTYIVNCSFSYHTNQQVPVDKALFLLDLLEVGRRKNTQLRQTLLGDDIMFPSYRIERERLIL